MATEHMVYTTSNYSGEFVQNITDNTCVSTIPITGRNPLNDTAPNVEPLYIVRVNHNKDIAITRTVKAKELNLPYLSINHRKEVNILFLDALVSPELDTVYTAVKHCVNNIEEIKNELIDTGKLAFATGEFVRGSE